LLGCRALRRARQHAAGTALSIQALNATHFSRRLTETASGARHNPRSRFTGRAKGPKQLPERDPSTQQSDAIVLKSCPDCGQSGEGALVRRRITHKWQEGVHEKRQYSAEIDVVACTGCGAEFIDEYARLQQHEFWCTRNGLLSPRAIRDLRAKLNLGREDFARLLRLRAATVRCWERGVVVQSAPLDSLMRLLARPEVVADLARWAASPPGHDAHGRDPAV
jgi:DNA-binding transcriptional regulator YiaG